MLDPLSIGLIGLLVFFILLAFGVSVGICLGLVGFVGFSLIVSFPSAAMKLAVSPFDTASSYDLATIPLFIFMAHTLFSAGFTTDLFDMAYKWLGRFRGGLAIASIAACAVFAAISSSSMATAITLGLVALPQMRKFNYSDKLATGAIAAGGTLGMMIPPSGGLIIYGIMTQTSIGKLFMAGLIPGLLQALLFIATISIWCRINPQLAPVGEKFTYKERFKSVLRCGEIVLIIAVVLGGMFIGWFTATEAGAVGAFFAIIVTIVRKKFSLKKMKEACFETAKTTGFIYFLIIGAHLMNYFLAVSGIPTALAEWCMSLPVPPVVVILVIILCYLVMGCFMDALGIQLLTIPIFFPVVTSLGYDPIWFGIMLVFMCEVGCITPPLGMNVYGIAGITKVSMGTIFKGIAPFLLACFILVFILIVAPQTCLWLPSFMAH